jgi:hypothetical protein
VIVTFQTRSVRTACCLKRSQRVSIQMVVGLYLNGMRDSGSDAWQASSIITASNSESFTANREVDLQIFADVAEKYMHKERLRRQFAPQRQSTLLVIAIVAIVKIIVVAIVVAIVAIVAIVVAIVTAIVGTIAI